MSFLAQENFFPSIMPRVIRRKLAHKFKSHNKKWIPGRSESHRKPGIRADIRPTHLG